MDTPRHWLLKTEPGCFSIQHLADLPGQTTTWDGVRNYQARNFLRDMRLGDGIILYHSNVSAQQGGPAAVGTATVAREAYPDPTQFDPHGNHFDPKASPAAPRWDMVDVRLADVFPVPVRLAAMRAEPGLAGMELLRRGSRLSVLPLSAEEYGIIVRLGSPATAGGQS